MPALHGGGAAPLSSLPGFSQAVVHDLNPIIGPRRLNILALTARRLGPSSTTSCAPRPPCLLTAQWPS